MENKDETPYIEAVFEYARFAMTNGLLLSAGACLSIMTLIGSLLSHNYRIEGLFLPLLLFFVSALCFGVACPALSYLSQVEGIEVGRTKYFKYMRRTAIGTFVVGLLSILLAGFTTLISLTHILS